MVFIDDSPDYCVSTNPILPSSAPEVEQLPTSNRLVAKRPLVAKANKASLSKKSRKYRSNKATRQSRQATGKLARSSARSAQRRTSIDRMPKAQRLVSESDDKLDGKVDDGKPDSKLDNPTDEDNQTFKEEELGGSFNGQGSIIPQLTDKQQQELTDEQKEQLSQLISKQQEQKEVQPIKQLAWLGTHGRECNRSALATDSCNILCCGRGYHTERVLVKEKCRCRFKFCCDIECDTCKYYKTIHYCK